MQSRGRKPGWIMNRARAQCTGGEAQRVDMTFPQMSIIMSHNHTHTHSKFYNVKLL